MSDVALKEAQEKAAEAKAWGQEQARAADEARRELKKAQDAADSAAEIQAELDHTKDELDAANARVNDLVGEVAAADKRAGKNAEKAGRFEAIQSALGL